MQAYAREFARVYDKRWGGFAQQMAPRVHDLYASSPAGKVNRNLLDLCCGTAHLAPYFLDRGFSVTGIDLSAGMLHYARQRLATALETGTARLIRADASRFAVRESFGLVVSLYDSLNHLADLEALTGCFRCVFDALIAEGVFIFDLNTRQGLIRNWNSINVADMEDALIVMRGIYDGQTNRAITKLSGFVRRPDGQYERFNEIVTNTVFDMQTVGDALRRIGWRHVHCARQQELAVPIDDPESEGRVFFVARK